MEDSHQLRSLHHHNELKRHMQNVCNQPSPVPCQCAQTQEKEVGLRGLQNQGVPLLGQLDSGLQGILAEDVLEQQCSLSMSRALKVGTELKMRRMKQSNVLPGIHHGVDHMLHLSL